MCTDPLPLASVIAQSHHLRSRMERLDFFGITCLGLCIMALLTSCGALVWGRGVSGCALLWCGQVDFSAHFRRGSTWVCLSTALWAFGKMSFSEVNLIT